MTISGTQTTTQALGTGPGTATVATGASITVSSGSANGINGDAFAVTNNGTIAVTGGGSFRGIFLTGASSVINSATGVITTNGSSKFPDIRSGVLMSGSAAASVTNIGTINGIDGYATGVRLDSGGTVTNSSTGFIRGQYGVLVNTNAGTVTNAGTIQGTFGFSSGVQITQGGTVSNTGTISGQAAGVRSRNASGTITNSGPISGARAFIPKMQPEP